MLEASSQATVGSTSLRNSGLLRNLCGAQCRIGLLEVTFNWRLVDPQVGCSEVVRQTQLGLCKMVFILLCQSKGMRTTSLHPKMNSCLPGVVLTNVLVLTPRPQSLHLRSFVDGAGVGNPVIRHRAKDPALAMTTAA